MITSLLLRTLTSSLFLNFCRFLLKLPCVVAPLDNIKLSKTKFWKTQISRNILFSTCCEASNIKLSTKKFWKTQISQNILFSTCCEAKRKECCFHPRLPPEYPTHLSKNIEVIIANNKESFAW